MQDAETRLAVRGLTLLIVLGCLALLTASSADGTKRHKPSGVKGVVLDASCYGPCVEPSPPQPTYAGPVTVTVRRADDGVLVASQAVDDGRFRMRVKRGLYEVSSVVPNLPISPPPICPPGYVCIQGSAGSAVVVLPCLSGETKRAQVRRHRFTPIELHVTNVCVL